MLANATQTLPFESPFMVAQPTTYSSNAALAPSASSDTITTYGDQQPPMELMGSMPPPPIDV